MSQASQVTQDPPAAKIPRLHRGRERVSRLLDSAAIVFVERGYEGATTTEIAGRAGASIGSLYQFFPTKTLLAEALHVRELDALANALDGSSAGLQVPGRSPARIADDLLTTLLDFVALRPVFMILAERRDIDPARKTATRRGMLAQLARLLSGASPHPSSRQAETAAALVLTMMKASVSLLASAEKAEAEHLIAQLRAMLKAHLDKGHEPHP